MEFIASEKYVLFYALALLAEILGTVSGFGSSILFVPLASYFFDFHSVLGITALFHVFSNVSKIVLFKKGINWHMVQWLGISSIFFVLVGAALSKWVPTQQLELALSIFMIVIAILLLSNKFEHLKPAKKSLIVGGSFSGFVAGLVGTGGAIRGITLSAFGLEKNSFIATSAIIDLGVDSSRLLVYLYNGFIQAAFLYMIPPLLLISIVGSYLGKRLLVFIPEHGFQKLVLGVIIVVALMQIINVLQNLTT